MLTGFVVAPTGFASQFPIGSYVLRAVTDERYGPASSSSSRQGGEAHRNGKLRPCFVTFHDGPRVYVAPVLSAPQNANDENFLPFLVSALTPYCFQIAVPLIARLSSLGTMPTTGGCQLNGLFTKAVLALPSLLCILLIVKL